METTGTLITDPICTDIKGKNKWEFVLEIPGKFPTKIAFTAWADKGDILGNCAAGEELAVKANVESRDYNGRWYTDVKAWSITKTGAGAPAKPAPAPVASEPRFQSQEADLPF